MIWNIEVTDTFGGEANYSWVERYKVDIDPEKSDLAHSRAIKQMSGYSDVDGKSYWNGDLYVFKPYKMNVILFAHPVLHSTSEVIA
jgi:hypothetical protein